MPDVKSRRGGRPPIADTDKVAEIALALFVERGFDNVTMDDIAAAAKISRTTLWRLFPNKAEAFWGGSLDSLFEEFRELLDARPAAEGVLDSVLAVRRLQDVMAGPSRVAGNKLRIRIVGDKENIASADLWSLYERWCDAVSAHVARRNRELSGLEAQVAGHMVWAAVWVAVMAWAHSDEDEPESFYSDLPGAIMRLADL
jgi:AcrR family transcriptional regulator